MDSLKRKFASLYRHKMPTRDPTIPPDVEKAKHIRYSMTERADIEEGVDSDDIISAFDSGDEKQVNNPFDDCASVAEVLHSEDGTRENIPPKFTKPCQCTPSCA